MSALTAITTHNITSGTVKILKNKGYCQGFLIKKSLCNRDISHRNKWKIIVKSVLPLTALI
jgi:hypothetical protein